MKIANCSGIATLIFTPAHSRNGERMPYSGQPTIQCYRISKNTCRDAQSITAVCL